MKLLKQVKALILPDRVVPCRILRGPFRGARFMANPQHSLRYIFGVYEHELNGWLRAAIPRTNVLLDVGANHGYFCFGVMAAWKRLGRGGSVIAFEPQQDAFECIQNSLEMNSHAGVHFEAEQMFVGKESVPTKSTTLNAALERASITDRAGPTLIKIDVEGAEMDVLRGGEGLVRSGNLFVIEAHSLALLGEVVAHFEHLGHPIDVIHQRPLPLLGRESRDIENYWVVSRL